MADGPDDDNASEMPMAPRTSRRGRIVRLAGLGLAVLMLIAVVAAWIDRRPIATRYLDSEFKRRGVTATYRLGRIGLRTQEVSNLVIGDPKRPDLVARFARVETRLRWNGRVEVYRLVVRGVRLRGRVTDGRVSWGEIDRLIPAGKKPFTLPDVVLDVRNASVDLATPFGPVAVTIEGNGRLSGGFAGHAMAVSPRLEGGGCAAAQVRASVALAVVARRPRIEGPVALARLTCPERHLNVAAPRIDLDAAFNDGFTTVDAKGRLATGPLTAGSGSLASLAGDISYKGDFDLGSGQLNLSARNARFAALAAGRSRLDSTYRLHLHKNIFRMNGDFSADRAALDPGMTARVTRPLAAAAKIPVGPVATGIGDAIARTARDFAATGQVKIAAFPGGGAVRFTHTGIAGSTGGRIRLSGGSGATYYWPAAALRIDGKIETGDGGLPRGRVTISQRRAGGPVSGVANFDPYAASGQRLALGPVRFGPGPGGSTAFGATARLDGRIPKGAVQVLRLPIGGLIQKDGRFALGTACVSVSAQSFRMNAARFGPTHLRVCPLGPAIIAGSPGRPLLVSARFDQPVLDGQMGKTRLHARADGGKIIGKRFAFDGLAMRIGDAVSPVSIDAAHLEGSFVGAGISGTFLGATAMIDKVPLLLSDGSGRWRVHDGDLTVDASATVSDRDANPRFYPLKSDNLHLELAGGEIRATGALHHPASGALVTGISIDHRLSSGVGHAELEIPGLDFSEGLQPDEITRLTSGVIALVNGRVSGRGRVDWDSSGKITSTGDFSTAKLDLAAMFGPVNGLSGTIHFDDLLRLTTPFGQTLTVKSVNPGILVENGNLHYQLLPDQLVRIERGEWPFMGGRLILHETVLNFARPTPKRLTFEVVGLDAREFIASLGFKGLAASGAFDGVLPMIFDENGGRIVGGRLDSRSGGGSLAYNSAVNKADFGTMGAIAFNALRDLRFKSMIVRLDGDLAGEFTTRLAIEGVGPGNTGSQKLIRNLLSKIPLKLNVTVSGPFRALITTAKSMADPRAMIGDVLPRPLDDVPGITTEVRRIDDDLAPPPSPADSHDDLAPQPKLK